MRDVHQMFAAFLDRVIGSTEPVVVEAALSKPWVRRGVTNALHRLSTSTDDIELRAIWALAFEEGAQECARFARIVLSDPAIKGRELDALKLIADGLSHIEIRLALQRVAKPACKAASDEGTVVAFNPKGDNR